MLNYVKARRSVFIIPFITAVLILSFILEEEVIKLQVMSYLIMKL